MRMVGKIALVMLALACAENPATGKRQLNLVSKSQEISMGKEAAQEVAQTVGIYESPGLQRYVSELGQKLAAKGERPDLPWSFQVVDDSAVNAFALPGGPIFITRGILAHMNNEAQLASVVGHEIGHVTAKHSVNQISKAQLAQLGLGLGMILSEDVRRFGQLEMAGLQVLFLKFGRDDENQADELGLRYAARAGYDVRQMSAMFQTLERVSGGTPGRLPEWLSTHPDPEHRVEKTNARILQQGLTGGKVAADEYLRAIDGITFGPDPRQGYFQGDRFLHPDLRFTVTFPHGWQRSNLKDAVVAVSPDQDALVQITTTPYTDPAQALQRFTAQQGVQPVGGPGRVSSALPSAAQPFTATTEEGALAGVAAFIAHQGHVYQVLELTTPDRLSALSQAFTQVPASFAELNDPAALAVRAAKVQVFAVPRPMTLAQLAQERPSSVPIETLAMINQLQPDTSLTAGQKVKWIVGGTREAQPVSMAAP